MLKYILGLIIDNLKFAEQKHSISIAINSGIIVFTSAYFFNKSSVITATAFCVVAFSAISLIFNFIALLSRSITIEKNSIPATGNLLYFKNISTYDEKQYLLAIKTFYNFPKEYVIDNFDTDLAKQIIANSKVANIKFSFFNKSLYFLFLAVSTLILLSALLWVGL